MHDPAEDDPSLENVLPLLFFHISSQGVNSSLFHTLVKSSLQIHWYLLIVMLELHLGIAVHFQHSLLEASDFKHSNMWVLPNGTLIELTSLHHGMN